MSLDLSPKPKLPSARYILKRVAFYALQQGFHAHVASIPWDRMIQTCAKKHCTSLRGFELMVERAHHMLDRTSDELTRTSKDGSKPTDLDICYHLLVEN